jgi:hypothetical protein
VVLDGKIHGYWRELPEFSCVTDIRPPVLHILSYWIPELLGLEQAPKLAGRPQEPEGSGQNY